MCQGPHGPLASIGWFAKTYGRSFFFIFIITVPMMLLAALLGAVVATFTTPHELVSFFPVGNVVLILIAMLVIALVASFVPAPIALDVILTAILFNIGMRADYAMVTLIGLGIFQHICLHHIVARHIHANRRRDLGRSDRYRRHWRNSRQSHHAVRR